MLTNKNAVSVLTSDFLVTIKIRSTFPMRDSSIVTQYRAVNAAVCRGVRKARSCPPVGGINSMDLNSVSVKIITKKVESLCF